MTSPLEPERAGQVKRPHGEDRTGDGRLDARRDAGGAAVVLPSLRRGARAGLFGGSFDPAHEGHLAVAEAARRACRLDAVLWLVTPRSPLKASQGYAPLGERVRVARRLTHGRPWLHVAGFEAQLGTRFTSDTIKALRARRPDLGFVWVMGADSLASFHRWRDWRGIARSVPLLVVSRPGYAAHALTSPAARTLGPARLPAADAARLPHAVPPAWAYLPGISVPVNSTALRAARVRDGTRMPRDGLPES